MSVHDPKDTTTILASAAYATWKASGRRTGWGKYRIQIVCPGCGSHLATLVAWRDDDWQTTGRIGVRFDDGEPVQMGGATFWRCVRHADPAQQILEGDLPAIFARAVEVWDRFLHRERRNPDQMRSVRVTPTGMMAGE